MALSDKRLLRRVRPFIPPGVRVITVESAIANPVDPQRRPTPVVLTDQGLLLITATGTTGMVTDVPFHRVTAARSEGTVLTVSFRDEEDRPRVFEADFGRASSVVEQFLEALRRVQPKFDAEDDRVPVLTVHAAWDEGRGATFSVFDDHGRKHIRPAYDADVFGLEAAELCKQAMAELSKVVAEKPELVWVRERAAWMPEFVWDPPLPPLPGERSRRA